MFKLTRNDLFRLLEEYGAISIVKSTHYENTYYVSFQGEWLGNISKETLDY